MLIYENDVPGAYRAAFINKVKEVSSRLGINPNWLMAVMHWESARTFSASVQNPRSRATGLIQFMPSTAEGMGTTIEQLARMSEVEQLEWVYKYYAPYKSRLKSFTDLYLTTFYPVAVGKPSSYILGNSDYRRAQIADQNPSFDNNKDGVITKGEIEADMLNKIPGNWVAEFKKKAASSTFC